MLDVSTTVTDTTSEAGSFQSETFRIFGLSTLIKLVLTNIVSNLTDTPLVLLLIT